jgi:hypothetical protein
MSLSREGVLLTGYFCDGILDAAAAKNFCHERVERYVIIYWQKRRILVASHVTSCNEMRCRIGTVAQQGRAFRHNHIPGIRSACLRRHLRGREHNRLHPRQSIVGRRFVGRSVAQAGPDDGLCPCQKDRPTRTSWEQHPTARGQRCEAKVRSESPADTQRRQASIAADRMPTPTRNG